MQHNSIVFVFLLSLLCASAESVRVTVRNLTGENVRIQNGATNDWRWTFPPGESVAEVPVDSYQIMRNDADVPVTMDLVTDSTGFIVQVSALSSTTLNAELLDRGSPLQWAFWGMGLGCSICGVGWSFRNAKKIMKTSIED